MTEEGTDAAVVGATLQELALCDIIGPHIGALIEEYAEG
jgi:hypothetical protein